MFRAFTTAAFCVAAGAREVVLVADHLQALALKRDDPGAFLTGEIGGKPIPGFDIGNSPSVIEHLDLAGRRVVQRTSAGTQGVVAAAAAEGIALGSFVIAAATAKYVASMVSEVTIVAMGPSSSDDSDEDLSCAQYLAGLLRGEHPDMPRIPMLGDSAPEGWPSWFPRRDAELALDLDRFDFALPVAREGDLLVARRVR